MNVILLSGGSGKRLWPLSNDVRSKQFIKLFKDGDKYESMVQRVYRQITTVDADAKITIATSKSQASAIKNQLGEKASICVEPCRRDTFPAIALAAAYLHDELNVGTDEAVVVCPVDPYVDNTYYEAVKALQELAEQGNANLTLMGIEPTYPSEKYGYIIPESGENVSKVKEFKEKPDVGTAKKYLAQSACITFELGLNTTVTMALMYVPTAIVVCTNILNEKWTGNISALSLNFKKASAFTYYYHPILISVFSKFVNNSYILFAIVSFVMFAINCIFQKSGSKFYKTITK